MINSNIPFRLYQLIDFELFVLILILATLSYLFYKFFLKAVSDERHKNLKNHFKNLTRHVIFLTIFYIIFNIGFTGIETSLFLKKVLPYLAALTYFWGALVFVKSCRLLVLQYMFLGSMRAGVPLLLVNIFSLLLSVGIAFWTISHVFDVQLTPILATSAAFSIVLGLALQDTLGNLFAGISLQIDKTFEIGDWLEVQNGLIKIVGQVKELSWRSTILVGLSDELITIPNKLIASLQVSNFSPENTPIVRNQMFRISFNSDREKAKELLETAISQLSDVRGIPAPFAYIHEVTENWIAIKVIYFIDSYGKQFVIGDKVYNRGLEILKQHGIEPAHQIIQYRGDHVETR